MSFLAPLYLLGGLAVSLPVLLHLIRRTPRGRQPFSSLMFLSPSPPRITRRSRIEHWLLLALRAAATVLLAAAFARPFLRESSHLLFNRGPGRQVALLIDSSASMQRSGVWAEAVRRAEQVLDQLGPNDVVALYRFDSTLQLVVGFPEPGTPDRQAHQVVVRDALRQLAPSWQATNLGLAMATVADSLAASRRDQDDDRSGQIVVISDCQQGADLSALQGYEWPKDVLVTIETVNPSARGNASVRLLANTAEVDLRARLANSADATAEAMRVGWVNANGELVGSTEVHVPAGQTRVVKVDERPAGADRLRIEGDSQEFDNDFFVAPFVQHEFTVMFLGDDAADDPRGLRYFLDRVWDETPRRKVKISECRAQDPVTLPQLNSRSSSPLPDLMVSAGVSTSHRPALQAYLEAGGSVLLLAVDRTAAQAIAEFLPGVSLGDGGEKAGANPVDSADERKAYALLRDFDFTHPILATFSEPRFGDFTKVRFWSHQQMQVEPSADTRVLAHFDDGSPALWEQSVGQGRVYVFTSTWRPSDSQLALSSKFVPLMASLLEQAAGVEGTSAPHLTIGQSITLPSAPGESALVITPDGMQQTLSADVRTFTNTDMPGTYRFQWPDKSHAFAVNLPAAESDTVPVAVDQLEQLGVRIGAVPGYKEQLDRERQLRDIELESRQKLWQWLIVAALGIVGIETFVAHRIQSQTQSSAPDH